MIIFIPWFAVLTALVKFNTGWSRGVLVALYLVGTVLVGVL